MGTRRRLSFCQDRQKLHNLINESHGRVRAVTFRSVSVIVAMLHGPGFNTALARDATTQSGAEQAEPARVQDTGLESDSRDGAPTASARVTPDLPASLHKGPRQGEQLRIWQNRSLKAIKQGAASHFPLAPLTYIPLGSGGAFLSIHGEERMRTIWQDRSSLGTSAQPRQLNIQFRHQYGAELHLNDHVRFIGDFVYGQVTGKNYVTPAIDRQNNGPEVSQAFIEIQDKILNGRTGVVLGRQKMQLGSGSIISLQIAQNIQRSYDGVRAYYERDKFRFDVIAVSPTKFRHGAFNDGTSSTESIWGGYAAIALRRNPRVALNLDAFYFRYRDEQSVLLRRPAIEQRNNYGTRLWGVLGPAQLDLTVNRQTGSVGDKAIRAWSLISATRVNLSSGNLSPALILQADVLSGGDRNASAIHTYNHMYGRQRHNNFGNLLGLTNIYSFGTALSVRPQKDLVLQGGARKFWRYSILDGHAIGYQTAVNNTKTRERFIGTLASISAQLRLTREISARAVVAKLFSSDGYKEIGQRDLTNLSSEFNVLF
jgi:hypothetical protein